MSEEKESPIIGYMCAIDWRHELGQADWCKVYDSVETLKHFHKCWEECGIVEVEVKLKKYLSLAPDMKGYEK